MGPGEPGSQVSAFKCTLSAGVARLLDRSCALPDTTPNPTFDEHGRFDHIFTAISNTCKHYDCIVSASCANRDRQAKHVQDRRVAENSLATISLATLHPTASGLRPRLPAPCPGPRPPAPAPGSRLPAPGPRHGPGPRPSAFGPWPPAPGAPGPSPPGCPRGSSSRTVGLQDKSVPNGILPPTERNTVLNGSF